MKTKVEAMTAKSMFKAVANAKAAAEAKVRLVQRHVQLCKLAVLLGERSERRGRKGTQLVLFGSKNTLRSYNG